MDNIIKNTLIKNTPNVYIGTKPVMVYVLAVTTQLNKANEVIIKARGRAISRAVDTVEIARNKFISGLKVKEIKIGTETMKREDGSPIDVSVISIRLRLSKNPEVIRADHIYFGEEELTE